MPETGKKQMMCSVVILAAGYSARMGLSKPFLKWDERVCFLEHIIDQYRSICCGKVAVVLNKENLDRYRVGHYNFLNGTVKVINEHPEYERFYSIQLGIKASGVRFPCFIQDGDNPFVTESLLSMLYQQYIPDGWVVPAFEGRGGHPVLIGTEAVNKIMSIETYETTLKDELRGLKKIIVPTEDPSIRYNINTIEDYNKHFGESLNVNL
ncbi:MAG: NTP transferase domain-containing protein [Bacteroidota bacterium]